MNQSPLGHEGWGYLSPVGGLEAFAGFEGAGGGFAGKFVHEFGVDAGLLLAGAKDCHILIFDEALAFLDGLQGLDTAAGKAKELLFFGGDLFYARAQHGFYCANVAYQYF